MNAYQITALVFAGIFVVGLLMQTYKIHFWKYANRPQTLLPSAPQDKKYAILIPARDESKVIRGLLDGIARQTYNQDNLEAFVIVERKDDPSVRICREYKNTQAFCLSRSPGSKGGAIRATLRNFKKNGRHFDGYFIIDADNIPKDDFIEHMHNALCAGNDVVLGGRINKKPSGNMVVVGSTLTWTFLNTLNNKCRSENGKNILVQGSPLLIGKRLIEDFWDYDWPLTGMTEDLELGYECNLHDFKSFYYEYALCYDEQPDNRKAGWNQRLRWVKGHHQANFKYMRKFKNTKCKYNDGIYKYDTLFSLLAPLIIIIDCALFVVVSVVMSIVWAIQNNPLWVYAVFGAVFVFVGIYLILLLWTLFGMLIERKNLGMTKRQWVQGLFGVPFFYIQYIPIYIKSLFSKHITWTRIEHKEEEKKNKK